MLVLTRKVKEAIVIAGKVRVVVAEVRSDRVRLGVEAPHDVTVDREEIHLRVLQDPAANVTQPPGELAVVVGGRHDRRIVRGGAVEPFALFPTAADACEQRAGRADGVRVPKSNRGRCASARTHFNNLTA